MGEVESSDVLDDMRGRSQGSTEGDGSSGAVLLSTSEDRLLLLGSLLTDVGISSDLLDCLGGRLVDDRGSVAGGRGGGVGVGCSDVVGVAQNGL